MGQLDDYPYRVLAEVILSDKDYRIEVWEGYDMALVRTYDPLRADQYSWHCATCKHTQPYGAARLQRDLGATKHLRERPDHRLALRKTITEHVLEPHAPKLPIEVGDDLDAVPF